VTQQSKSVCPGCRPGRNAIAVMDSCGGVPQGKPQYVKEVDSDKHAFSFHWVPGKIYIFFKIQIFHPC